MSATRRATLSMSATGRSATLPAARVHNDLTGRAAADSHPIAAITGLVDALNAKLNIVDQFIKSVDASLTVSAGGEARVTNPLPAPIANSGLATGTFQGLHYDKRLGLDIAGNIVLRKPTAVTYVSNALPNNLSSTPAEITASHNQTTAWRACDALSNTYWAATGGGHWWKYTKTGMTGNLLAVMFQNYLPLVGNIQIKVGGVTYTVASWSITSEESQTTYLANQMGILTGLPSPFNIVTYPTIYIDLGSITTVDEILVNITTISVGTQGIAEIAFFTVSDMVYRDEIRVDNSMGFQVWDKSVSKFTVGFTPYSRRWEYWTSTTLSINCRYGELVVAAHVNPQNITIPTLSGVATADSGYQCAVLNMGTAVHNAYAGAFNGYFINNGVQGVRYDKLAIPVGEGVIFHKASGSSYMAFKSWTDLVKFPATQVARTEATYLDDYAEVADEVAFTCGSGTATINASYKTLAICKVGRQVQISGTIAASSISSPSGTLTVTGLLYKAASGASYDAALNVIVQNTLDVGAYEWKAYVINNTNTIRICLIDKSTGTIVDAASYLQSNTTFILGGSYYANA